MLIDINIYPVHFLVTPAACNSLPDYLREPTRPFDSFRSDLKTYLFSLYWRTQRIGGFAIMRYINLLLTLTLTMLLLQQMYFWCFDNCEMVTFMAQYRHFYVKAPLNSNRNRCMFSLML